jgi:hypothetical protein
MERFMWRFGGDTGRLGRVKKRRCREIREFYSRYYIKESQGDIYRDLEEIQRDFEEVQQNAKRFMIHGRLGRFGEDTDSQRRSRLGDTRRFGMGDVERFRKDTGEESERSRGHTWRSGEDPERS